jgi:hypothetical protein
MAMDTRLNYLAAGQRYARLRLSDRRADDQVTILAVSQDRIGTVWITFRTRDGRDYFRPAREFQTAVAAGELVPLTVGPIANC